MFAPSSPHAAAATRPVPPIDLQVPATLETATFANG
jgi:hypothetical protein